MRVLQIHNRYRYVGGEDAVVAAERQLLENRGHNVEVVGADNQTISRFSSTVNAAFRTVYSPASKSLVASKIHGFRPDVVHVHNFFPLLSPSIYYACGRAHVPVVQTLHNYRLVCPNAQLLRGSRICEECVGKIIPTPAVMHACYRASYLGSAAVAGMLVTHRILGTWNSLVDIFIALSDFSRAKLVSGGLPAKKIVVKPNFLRDPGDPSTNRDSFGLFVGRLSPEKGIELLLAAWRRVSVDIALHIVGDGPLSKTVMDAKGRRVNWHGPLLKDQVHMLIRQASFVVVPSTCYENFPLVIAEAFAAGVPVIAAGHGAMVSLVENGSTGLHFRPGDAEDLARTIQWAATHSSEMDRMGHLARQEYLAKYTPERNYEMLMQIYECARDRAPKAGE